MGKEGEMRGREREGRNLRRKMGLVREGEDGDDGRGRRKARKECVFI